MAKKKKITKRKANKKQKKVKAKKSVKYHLEKRKFAPLKTSFMFISMLGFLFSVLIVKKWSITWAFTLAIFFALLFAASLITMRNSASDSQLAPRIKNN